MNERQELQYGAAVGQWVVRFVQASVQTEVNYSDVYINTDFFGTYPTGGIVGSTFVWDGSTPTSVLWGIPDKDQGLRA